MSFLTKEAVQRAEKYLKEFDTNLEVISLETSARTAAEAASSLECEVGAIVKSLLFSADDNFILCLVSGDKKASLNKLKKNLNIKNMEMAKAEDVKK
jgi:prolyl-tRNA editing enzyme YbaK/EbsC (Cys-tRNA(Pro) deacylase)